GIAAFASSAHGQCVSLTTLATASSQNFDTLATTGTNLVWTDNSTIPGTYSTRTTYNGGTGSSNTGALWSFGVAGVNPLTDRALGGVGSGGTGTFYWAVCYTNNTGAALTSLDVAYIGEQWRDGLPVPAAAQTIAFEYQVAAAGVITDADTPATGWSALTALNFTSPITGTAAAALDGNAAANRTAKASPIAFAPSVGVGNQVWLRWRDINDTSNDHGLAIDDLSVTPQGGVPLPNLTVNDISLNEGNAGTTSFTFTVSLSAPAGPGGVTFDISTADGTASQPGDYTQKSLTGQTIPAGSSTYSFTVLANGDITPETNETFVVNVTNVTGATATDGQGLGTIVNDDAAPNLTLNDVSLNEGNAGTTTFTFTVSLSAPAPPGGVTFDIATANGTASQPGDYTQKSLTGQTIPNGSSTYTFDVLVNGDFTPENDETFFVNVTNVTNAIAVDGQGLGTIVNDDLTFIHDVQGSGAATPIPGSTVTVEGIVIGDFQASNQTQGFFLQEEDADADANPATSEGIFVFCNSCPTAVAEGQRVRVTGTVSEFFNATEITASTAGSVLVTNAGNNLAQVTPATIDLPVVGVVNDFYEPREGMRVTFVDTLSVSEYFELARYGQIELFEGGRPRQFTETAPPSVAGYNAHLDALSRRRVILDDDDNAQNASLLDANGFQFIYPPRANGGFSVGTQGTDFFRGGDLVNGLTGVLDWSFAGLTGTEAWRIRPTAANPATFTVANPRPASAPLVGGAIRAVGMNLLNYFTTIDTTSSTSSGPCAPSATLDCRGADSVAELNRQRERASIVICTLNADAYGFGELENTTPSASITDLLGAVNARCGGTHPYAFANTGGTLGTDAIRVQIIYRTGILGPVGAPLSDLDPIHSRPPTAQTFDVVDATNPAFGERFTVVANHLKSKGSSAGLPGDADAGDGAGASNATRTAQAARLLTWVNSTVIPAAGDPDVLLLGDFNSYAAETPVTTLLGGGYTDLESAL
ncbi:MAG: ExeM/NucH family extracellular endonuclease, partial [Thermoanaerobaculia bacterium]